MERGLIPLSQALVAGPEVSSSYLSLYLAIYHSTVPCKNPTLTFTTNFCEPIFTVPFTLQLVVKTEPVEEMGGGNSSSMVPPPPQVPILQPEPEEGVQPVSNFFNYFKVLPQGSHPIFTVQ